MLTDMYKRWLFEAWGKGDDAVAAELIAADVVDHNALPGQPGGLAGERWAAHQIRRAFPDLEFTCDVVFESGNLVTGRWTMRATHTGTLDLLGLPPTGRPVVMSGQEIFRAEGGKFVEMWHVEDTGALMRVLELEPPPAMLKLAARRSARRYRRRVRAS